MPPPNRLLIMRHADAQPRMVGGQDRERELSAHGLQQAAARRAIVVGAAPKVVLCSPATRAVQTVAGLGPIDAEVIIEDPLYSASATSLLLRLAELAEETDSAMIVGHLPAVGELTDALLPRDQAMRSFNPAAVVHLELPHHWPALQPASARLLAWHP